MKYSVRRVLSVLLILSMLVVLMPAFGQAAPAVFVDDAGRSVTLPTTITTWAPSGVLAQQFLYSVDPAMLAGWAQAPTTAQQPYIDSSMWYLPVFGQIYGTASVPSGYDEAAVIASGADLIIDIGQAKTGIAAVLDQLELDTGIPVIFIEAADLDDYDDVYSKLGVVLGSTTKTGVLETYASDLLTYVATQKALIPSGVALDRTVYYGEGVDGLLTNGTTGPGSIHQQLIPFVGGINVANINSPQGKGQTPVTITQVQGWQPETILFGPGSIYSTVESDPNWAGIPAIDNYRYVQIPEALYNWFDRPTSANRLLGAKWMANLLFPEYYPAYNNMQNIVIDFYKKFYHYTMTTTEVDTVLAAGQFGGTYPIEPECRY